MFKVNNKCTRTTPGVVLLSLSLTSIVNYFTPCSSVSIVNFEHVITGWVDWNEYGDPSVLNNY